MPFALTDLFSTNSAPYSTRWIMDLVERAYGERLDLACKRLGSGVSLLLHVPGSCMEAVGMLLEERMRAHYSVRNVHHFGRRDQGANGLLAEWEGWGALFGTLGDPNQLATTPPRPIVIIHNLDLLANERGELEGFGNAKNAQWALVETARRTALVGLCDRETRTLPESIRKRFAEELRLEEIARADFHKLIPRALGVSFADASRLPEAYTLALAHRLRFEDPVRVVTLLDAGSSKPTFDEFMIELSERMQPADFERPSEPSNDTVIGVPRQIEKLLRGQVIKPYRDWMGMGQHGEDASAFDTARRRLLPGLILHGPPGTGKSHLARWLVAELGLPVRFSSAAEIKASGYGDAERNVRELLRAVRRAAPCVLVLDDADDLLPDRNQLGSGNVAGAERGIVNAFLQGLEGARDRTEGSLAILTTNRFEHLDPAAKERLPLHLRVPYPDRDQIEQLLDVLASELALTISKGIRPQLIARFEEPVDGGRAGENPHTANSNRFGPREMRNALRLLVGPAAIPGSPYEATAEDMERLTSYYERQ